MTSDAKLLDRLAERWQRNGVALRPGLSGSMVRLPAGEPVRVDVLPALLRRFDGFEGDASDADGFRFWSLGEMVRLVGRDARLARTGRWVLFCDYLHWSWAYGFDNDPASPTFGCVAILGTATGQPQVRFPSMWEFLEGYLQDSAGLVPE